MLLRAARRKPSPHLPTSARSTDECLPWRFPALRQQIVHSRWNSDDANSHGLNFGKRRNSKDGFAAHPRRSLATHTTTDTIPCDGDGSGIIHQLPSLSETRRKEVEGYINLRHLDVNKAILVGFPVSVSRKKYRLYDGVGGDVSEMYNVLQGCLCVGRMKRAETIIKRLEKIQAISVAELMKIHLEFVRVSVERIVANANDSDTQELHKWFELNVRQRYDFDYAFLAYMLKAALRDSSEQKRNRLVHRYMELLPPGDVSRDLHNEYTILSENELELIQSITEEPRRQVGLNGPGQRPPHLEGAEALEESSVSTEQSRLSAAEAKEVPEVRPVELKGLGLKMLKGTLSSFSTGLQQFDPISLTHEQRKERQTRIEESAVSSAIDRWREENAKLNKIGMNTALQTKNLGARMWKWQLALEEYIKSELERLDALEGHGHNTGESEERMNLAIWLRYLPAEQLAAATILAAMNRLSTSGLDKGVTTSSLVMHLGQVAEDESSVWQFSKITKANPTNENKRKKGFLIQCMKRKRSKPFSKLPKQDETGTEPIFSTESSNSWLTITKAHVGAFLVTALLKTATIPVTRVNPANGEIITQIQPAFSRVQQYRYGKKVGIILTNSALVEQLKREPVHSLLARHLPMIVEPTSWTKFNAGGFIAHPTKVIRIKHSDKDQRHYAEAAIGRGDLDQIFKGLDVLGKQAWQINKPVFDIMLEAWNSGKAIAKIPAAKPKLDMPLKPAVDADPLERKHYLRAIKAVENTRAGLHSQRCFQNFQLEIARALRNETFYFPHNLDFRGRAYPVPPLLNHMGADHCRGILKFGEAKPLGESGLQWLKIHLANVYGFDKASLSERKGFADKHLDDIYDSAADPLGGKRWWLTSDDPWQTLAACMELRNALESPDPTKYMSSLPVHQDGTCNGLQHYAALGGDEWGARQVNLEPGDRPADVYTAVADLVIESMAKDIAKGNPLAKVLEGQITRKVVKQTVMTNVYGVTYIGAKNQVRRQLAIKDLRNDLDLHAGHFAGYVATKIFEALSSMFKGAHEIQHWLGECASRISTALTPEQLERMMEEYEKYRLCSESGTKYDIEDADSLMYCKSAVVWTTPLHMPVVQPYRVSKARKIKTSLQQISISEPHRSDPVSKRKQLQAFPPNFVHSLDATHMMLSALKCYELGLSFAAVHDSFWTHASDVETMNRVLREAFIKIHSDDVIARLGAEFEVRYKGCYHHIKIKPGSPVVKKLNSLRKSKEYRDLKAELLGGCGKSNRLGVNEDKRADELIVELKVAQMLQSKDPAVVARALSIQTPGRIFREMAVEEDVEVPAELVEIGVGKIPGHDAKLKTDVRPAVGDVEDMENMENMENIDPFEDPISDEGLSDSAMGGSESEELSDAAAAKSEPGPWGQQSLFEDAILGKRKQYKRTSSYTQASSVWVPLTFPRLPKRGDFDVSRLRQSKYFFS